jgi:DNA polymerase III subunit delta'
MREGLDAVLWTRLPAMLARGEAAGLVAWPLPRQVDALQKLCHDALCVAAGAAPRYFPVAALARSAGIDALCLWARHLNRIARHAEHPWHAGLMTDALVQQAQRALAGAQIVDPA